MYPQPAVISTSQHFIQSFSWMLLHSLWQGLLLAIFGGFLLILTKKSSSVVRYNLLLVQLFIFITACVLTFAWEWKKSLIPGFAGAVPRPGRAYLLFFELNANGLQHFAKDCVYWVSANATVIVFIWLLLFIFRSVRLMGSLVYIHRARHRFVYQPSRYWADKVEGLCLRLQLNRAVRLLESGYVKMPMVIGHLKPIILVPMGLIAGLPAGQVEAILLHELAHIRRHDYVVNIIQTIAETVFCFNPGLLWLSSALRDERENCCDDIALAQTKNKKEFVQALINFKEHALYGTSYQVAFPGKKNHLLNRVSRIIGNKNPAFGLSEKASFIAGLLILLTMVATAAITGSHRVRHANRPSVAVAVQTVAVNKQATEATVKAKLRKARVTPAAKLKNADSTPASKNDSARLLVAVGNADRMQGIAAIARETPAVAAQQDRKARADDPAAEKLQADRDREQAKKDQAQAIIDREQAKRDEMQALKDKQQALRGQKDGSRDQERGKVIAADKQNEVSARQRKMNQDQGAKNREQVARNEEQVKLNQQQDLKNAEQARRNEEQAQLNKIQEQKNAEQEAKNGEQARLNKIQEQKNAEQAKHNEQQAKLNEQQQRKSAAQAAIDEKKARQNNEQAEQNKVSVQQ